MLSVCAAVRVGISIPFIEHWYHQLHVGSYIPCYFWWLKLWLSSCLLPCRFVTRRGRGKMYCQMNISRYCSVPSMCPWWFYRKSQFFTTLGAYIVYWVHTMCQILHKIGGLSQYVIAIATQSLANML